MPKIRADFKSRFKSAGGESPSRCFHSALLVAFLAVFAGRPGPASLHALPAARGLPYPIVFAGQVPVTGFTVATSSFGNHRPAVSAAPRGGDLFILYPDGALKNLTRSAGFGVEGFQGARSIAVREPSVHWSGQKLIFSMVIGSVERRYQTDDAPRWQLYEATGLGRTERPVITKVSNQPEAFNNVSPIYGTDDRILFTSDRPRDGALHLYPQLDEYESAPTVSGLWSLDPQSGDLFLLDHSPSGDFSPSIDSFGRVIFTRWDHLQRDQQADADSRTPTYGTFDYQDESPALTLAAAQRELFPEPRSNRTDLLRGTNLAGQIMNQFFPWQVNEDGTEHETLNHAGRHDLLGWFERSLTDDPDLRAHTSAARPPERQRVIERLLQMREDPRRPGTFFGVSSPEFSTDASGQIVYLSNAAPDQPPENLRLHYVTAPATASYNADDRPADPTHSGHYRNPLPLSDGTLIAAHTAETRADKNDGTREQPRLRYAFRLKVVPPGPDGARRAGRALTRGIRVNVAYWDPDVQVRFSGELWELDPVEVRPRARPNRRIALLPAPERAVLQEEGVPEAALRNYLRAKNLALIVSRNVAVRDCADQQQPYNLNVVGATRSPADCPGRPRGREYAVTHLQIFQGELLRGLGRIRGNAARPGRRVLARPMPAQTALQPVNSAIPGAVELAPDGSVAALVPARRAVSWQLTDARGTAVVRERYWLTLQPGEVRVCAACHGTNEFATNYRGAVPENKPEALRRLLRRWQANEPAARRQL